MRSLAVLGAVLLGMVQMTGSGAVNPGVAATSAAGLARVQLVDSSAALLDFELIDHRGKSLRLSSLRGRPLLVFFGFARCADVCPTVLHKLRQAARRPALRSGRARVVFISVDGTHDSPEVLGGFLAPITAEIVGLTGKPKQVRAIATQFSAAFAAGRAPVDHSSQVYLVDPQGRLRATFYNATPETIEAVVRRVAAPSGRG